LTTVVVDTGEKITAGVVDTGGHIFSEIYIDRGEIGIPMMSTTPVVNLPPAFQNETDGHQDSLHLKLNIK
jgi:hypothetical protein